MTTITDKSASAASLSPGSRPDPISNPTAAESIDKPCILAVDDTPDNLNLLSGLLQGYYQVKLANSGERALKAMRSGAKIDLVLLDVMMPGMDGFSVLRTMKAEPSLRDIPVIFLTAAATSEDEHRGLALGAVDYIAKPFSPAIVLARVKSQLQVKRHDDFMRDQNSFLKAEVERQTQDLSAIQNVTIQVMASLAETRDSDTGNHIRRTQYYVKALAEHLQNHPRFEAALTPEKISLIFKSAPLHDIGKVGIPDYILLKPGKLTAEEWVIMKTHAALGKNAIDRAEEQLGVQVTALEIAKEIAYGHHEKWDGSGYPQALSGNDIPVSARLMAVADVYDALICRRVYKAAMPHAKAVAIIEEGRGGHFDPDVVQAFRELEDRFQEIAQEYADSDEDLQQKAQYAEQALAATAATAATEAQKSKP